MSKTLVGFLAACAITLSVFVGKAINESSLKQPTKQKTMRQEINDDISQRLSDMGAAIKYRHPDCALVGHPLIKTWDPMSHTWKGTGQIVCPGGTRDVTVFFGGPKDPVVSPP